MDTAHVRAGGSDLSSFQLDRRTAVPALVGRHEDFLIVSGLGGTSRDMAALSGDGGHLFALGGAMGAATMVGLGLALARPERRVLVVTGDAELLMNAGALATVAMVGPRNLSIVCVDNGRYGETGNQESHTARTTDLELLARGAGIHTTATVTAENQLEPAGHLLREPGPVFVRLQVAATDPPAFKRLLDPAACRLRFRTSLAQARQAS